jgi:hypothetical protein
LIYDDDFLKLKNYKNACSGRTLKTMDKVYKELRKLTNTNCKHYSCIRYYYKNGKQFSKDFEWEKI